MAPSESQSAWDAQSKDAKRILAEDKYDDCLSCRITEQTIMRSATKYKMGSRKLGIATISATLVGMGIWRALN
ncbi:hypothetical protein GB937_001166 [Aspergillus fischeri]|nr:hypothetical protein GB937_001166 [Aspergillus fischeri]